MKQALVVKFSGGNRCVKVYKNAKAAEKALRQWQEAGHQAWLTPHPNPNWTLAPEVA